MGSECPASFLRLMKASSDRRKEGTRELKAEEKEKGESVRRRNKK